VDVGFSVTALEHLDSPQEFWNKVYIVLGPGGVFWALSMQVTDFWSNRPEQLASMMQMFTQVDLVFLRRQYQVRNSAHSKATILGCMAQFHFGATRRY
jgi:hypothetical protein